MKPPIVIREATPRPKPASLQEALARFERTRASEAEILRAARAYIRAVCEELGAEMPTVRIDYARQQICIEEPIDPILQTFYRKMGSPLDGTPS